MLLGELSSRCIIGENHPLGKRAPRRDSECKSCVRFHDRMLDVHPTGVQGAPAGGPSTATSQVTKLWQTHFN